MFSLLVMFINHVTLFGQLIFKSLNWDFKTDFFKFDLKLKLRY